MPGNLQDKVPVSSFIEFSFLGFRTGNPHRTQGRELKPTFCFPSSRFHRTLQLPSAWRSFCFEMTISGSARFKIEPVDSRPPG